MDVDDLVGSLVDDVHLLRKPACEAGWLVAPIEPKVLGLAAHRRVGQPLLLRSVVELAPDDDRSGRWVLGVHVRADIGVEVPVTKRRAPATGTAARRFSEVRRW